MNSTKTPTLLLEEQKKPEQKPEEEAQKSPPAAHAPEPMRGPETVAPHPHSPRGTAAMDPETRREVARKGGLAVSRNRSHMAEIGKKGGQSISRDRAHMAKIGKKGGETSRSTRKPGPLEAVPAVPESVPVEIPDFEKKKAG